jgi:transcriptional regulator with XRE-family HTH domain
VKNIYQKAFRNARLYKNLSLLQIASLLGVSKQFVWKIETGLKTPNIYLIKKLEQVTGLSFWALVAGDFLQENQNKYVKISNQNFHTMTVNFSEISTNDRNFFLKKYEVEIEEIQEEISEAKGRLAKRIEKSALSEGELSSLDAEVQKAKTNLEFLKSSNAPSQMIADQQAVVVKAENELADKKRKGGIISDREAYAEEISIKEMEMRIKLREDEIVAIKAVV